VTEEQGQEMKILITGGAGFIGSHLLERCIKEGHVVLCLDNLVNNNSINVRHLHDYHNCKLIKGDIRDSALLEMIMRDVNVVFHLAAYLPNDKSMYNPFLCFDINERGTLNLLKTAYLNGVNTFIYSSTMKVYSEPAAYLPVDEQHPVQPSTIYGVSKLASELYCGVYSKAMNIIMLRYSRVYGEGVTKCKPITTFISQALSNSPLTIYGDGTQSSDFVYVSDVVQANLQALEKNKPGIYNIGSGEEVSIRDLAERIISITGSKSDTVMLEKKIDEPLRFVLDITKSRKALGYSPLSLNEGLSRIIKIHV